MLCVSISLQATYDIAYDKISAANGKNLGTSLAASALSGLSCVITSLPFDLIKTRLQNMQPVNGVMPYRGVLDCAVKVLRNEGILAFWTGFGAYYGRTAPHAMIILLSVEQINKGYDRLFLL